jgi:heme-degrading monooxygenase HmoA
MTRSHQSTSRAGYVAYSRFVVANGMREDVRDAFRRRPGLVEGAPGFLRMEVISPLDRPEEFWLITFWTDETSFRAWHKSHTYSDSHAGIPKGLKLVRGETLIKGFEHVTS